MAQLRGLRIVDFTADPEVPDIRVVPHSLPASECAWPGHQDALDEAGYCPVCQQ